VKRKRFSVEQIVSSSEAGRGGRAGSGGVPTGRDYGADLLSVEEAFRRIGDRSGPAVEATSGGEREVEEAGGKLSLDKAMLQDVLSKKS
jgi:hypothetical protein